MVFNLQPFFNKNVANSLASGIEKVETKLGPICPRCTYLGEKTISGKKVENGDTLEKPCEARSEFIKLFYAKLN